MSYTPLDLSQWWKEESQKETAVQELGRVLIQNVISLQREQGEQMIKVIQLEAHLITQMQHWRKDLLKTLEERLELQIELHGEGLKLELESEFRAMIEAQIKATVTAELKETLDHMLQSFQTALREELAPKGGDKMLYHQ